MAEQKTLLDDPNFREFCVIAKKSTYAAGGDSKAEKLCDGGKRYVFYDRELWPRWRYTDIYHGYNPFFGNKTIEETGNTPHAIWTPIARMSYGGYARGTDEEIKRMFAFLEKILQRVAPHSLFRGPTEHIREDGLQYRCQWQRINPFCVNGKESIVDYTLHVGDTAHYQLSFEFHCLR